MFNSLVEYQNIVPLLTPADITSSATATPYVALKNAHRLALVAFFGNIAAASADQAVTVTVEAATSAASSATEAKVAFTYRLSGAVGANTWGTPTAAVAASGVSVGTTDDNKMLWIELDPAAVQTTLADASHVRLVITPDAGGSATVVGAFAVIDPRYAGVTMISAT